MKTTAATIDSHGRRIRDNGATASLDDGVRVATPLVMLGNGQVLTGQSLYAHMTNPTEMIRLLPSNCSNDLEPDRIKGNIIMCARDFGGSGLVSISPWIGT